MSHEHEEPLYLSKDKRYLKDEHDNIISMRKEQDGKVYYQSIGIESEGVEKLCTAVTPRKVCLVWNDQHVCSIWAQVDVCTKVELISVGYSNIS